MAEKLLTEMSYDEVDSLMNRFIDRSSQQDDELSATSFFELLFARAAERAQQTLEVNGRVVNGQLVLALPEQPAIDLYVQDNQIVIGNQRIIVNLST